MLIFSKQDYHKGVYLQGLPDFIKFNYQLLISTSKKKEKSNQNLSFWMTRENWKNKEE